MDRDEFFKILEEPCCYNIENYVFDKEWSSISGLSHIPKEDYEDNKEVFVEAADRIEVEAKRKEKNAWKTLEMSLEDSQYNEKVKRELEEARNESSHKFAKSIHSNLEEYHLRKTLFFIRMLNSMAENRHKYPVLNFNPSALLEKYSSGLLIQDTYPGLKPASNWPVSLDDLLDKLKTAKIEEVFHQPFDLKGSFQNEAIKFIKKQFENLKKTKEDYEVNCYKEFSIKGIQALLSLNLLEGNQGKITQTINLMKNLHEDFPENFEDVFASAIRNCEPVFHQVLDLLISTPSLPIIRDNSINEFFSISKNILYTNTRFSFNQSSSITIDSEGKYLYMLLSGINGGMIKVGTGKEATEKGRVYLFKKQVDMEDSYQWVFCRGKLYMKQLVKDFGNVSIINPENFEVEGKFKLLFPEYCQHSAIKKKNENYVLLSDGDKLHAVILEPVINKESDYEGVEDDIIDLDEEMEDDDEEDEEDICLKNGTNNDPLKNNKNLTLSDIYSYVNLMMYTYDVDTNYNSKINSHQENLIDELLITFSCFYTRNECYKALCINNWNFEKTALFLIDEGKKVKEQLLIPESSLVLMQTKLEGIVSKNSKNEFCALKNSIIDVTQYDSFRWAMTDKYVIAYKFKEKYCNVFSRNSKDVKELLITNEKNTSESNLNNEVCLQEDYTIRSSFVRKENCAHLTKSDYSLTYDKTRKIYYLIPGGSLISQNVLIADSFEDYSHNVEELLHNELGFRIKNNFKEDFFKSLENFENFDSKISELFLLFQSKKINLYWKYRNWNCFYTNYFNSLVSNHKDIKDKKILPLLKILSPRIESSREINELILKEKLGKSICDNYNLNFDGKYLDKKEFKEVNKKIGLPAGYENLNWASWNYNNQFIVNKKEISQECNENSFGICIENRKEYYMCMEGNEENLKIIVDNLKFNWDNIIQDINQDRDNISLLKRHLLSLYFFVESSDSSILINNLNKKQTGMTLVNSIINELNSILIAMFLDKKSDEGVKKLIVLILIVGWELLLYDLNSQYEWFERITEQDNISENRKDLVGSTCFVKSLFNQTLEENIFSYYKGEISSFTLLIHKLMSQGKNYLPFIIHRINAVKYYQFTKHQGNLYSKSLITSINPKSFQTPFYSLILGELFKNEESAELERKKQFDAETKLEIKTKKQIHSYSHLLVYEDSETLAESQSNTKANYIFEFDEESFTQKYFNSLRINSDDSKNSEIELKALSEKFYTKMKKYLFSDKSENSFKITSLVYLMSDLYCYSIGDILVNFEQAMYEESQNEALEVYSIKTHVILDKTFNFLLDLIRNINRKNSNFTNLETKRAVQLFSSCLVTTINHGMPSYNINLIKSYREKYLDLMSEIMKSLTDNKDNSLSQIPFLFNTLKRFSSGGFLTENEKNFEFSFSPSEVPNIYEKINFEGSSAVIVELDSKPHSERPNYDIVAISEEHSYSNLTVNSSNNFSNFGTCFMMKLSNSVGPQKLFLPGEEIKLMTNPEDQNRYRKQQTNKSINSKSVLKVKCYPYCNVVYAFPVAQEDSLNNFLGRNNIYSFDDLYLSLDLLDSIDYYLVYMMNRLIKSTDVIKEEKFLTDNLISNVLKHGLHSYEQKEINEFMNVKEINKENDICEEKEKKSEVDSKKRVNALIEGTKQNLLKKKFPDVTSLFIEEFVKDLQNIEDNRPVDLNSNVLNKIKLKIRELVAEPNNYRTLKIFPSFNSQMKSLWEICETTFILTILYHTDSIQESINWVSDESTSTGFDNHIAPFYEYLGKKLNFLLSWMISRVQYMKDTFDSIKNYSENIVNTNNNFINNVKILLMKKLKFIDEDRRKKELEKPSNDKKENSKSDAVKSKFHPNPIEPAFTAKTINFKKKPNTKRLYQELPKKKSKKEKTSKNSNDSKCSTPMSQTISALSEDLVDDLMPLESFPTLSIEELFKMYPQHREEFINKETVKKLKEEIRGQIEADVKEAYFGNVEKLKNICEINEITFSESNLNESLKLYTNFICNKLSKVYDFGNFDTCIELNLEEVYEKIYNDSPFKILADYVLDKLFFLMELNIDSSISEKIESLPTTPRGVYSKGKTKKICFDSKDLSKDVSPFLSRENSQISTKNDAKYLKVFESVKRFKKWELEDENVISTSQQNFIKSIFNWIFKSPNTNLIRNMINSQNVRLKVREIGLNDLINLISKDSYAYLSKLSSNLNGLFSYSLKNSIFNNLDCVLKCVTIKLEDLEKIILNYIDLANYELTTLTSIKVSDLKTYKLITDNPKKSKTSYEFFLSCRLKNLVLLISDINFLLSCAIALPNNKDNFNSNISFGSINKFIQSSLNLILNDKNKLNLRYLKMINEFNSNLRSGLSKLVIYSKLTLNYQLSENIIDSLFSCLDSAIDNCDDQVDFVTNLLDMIYHICSSSSFSNITSANKAISKLFAMIIKSEIPEIVSSSCKIAKVLCRNVEIANIKIDNDDNINIYEAMFEKLGKIWIMDETIKRRDDFNTRKESVYNIMIQMNSPEVDYLCLVNCFYQWEESHPTKLSEYKYEITSQSVADMFIRNSFSVIDHKTKDLTCFNPLRSKVSKSSGLESAINKRLEIIKKEKARLEELLKGIQTIKEEEEKKLKQEQDEKSAKESNAIVIADNSNNPNENSNDNSTVINQTIPNGIAEGSVEIKDDHPKTESEDELKQKLQKTLLKEIYLLRILAHVKTAEKIGEMASTRGFALIQCNLSKKEAEDFSELIYKSYYGFLPHIQSEAKVDDNNTSENLFNDDLMFPKLFKRDMLLPGCTNILKETIKPYLNVAVIKQELFNKLVRGFKSASEIFAKITDDYKKKTFSTNLNNIQQSDKINVAKFHSGTAMSLIIEVIINMIYHTGNNCENELMNNFKLELHNLKKDQWDELSQRRKMSILGFFIVISGFFSIIRPDSCVSFNNNYDEVCKVIAGGHFTGKTTANVVFIKDKQTKMEKVNLNLLKKFPVNENLLKILNLEEMMSIAFDMYEIYKNSENDLIISDLLIFILKLLSSICLEREDVLLGVHSEKIKKMIQMLNEISSDTKWMAKEDEDSEVELVEAWERVYSNLDKNSLIFYSPLFKYNKTENINNEICNSNPPNLNEDLITKLTLPESAFVSDLPKLHDMTKSILALKNIQLFERHIVEEVYRHCKNTYREHEYVLYLSQIRYHLSRGDISSARQDILSIFDEGKNTPPLMPWPRDHRETREVFKEECNPGNFYIARLSNRLIRELGIKNLNKQTSLGINEIPVLLLLVDNALSQSLVLYNDYVFAQTHMFWINTDNLLSLESPIKPPASSYSHQMLVDEYNQVKSYLKKSYAKNILTGLMRSLCINEQICNFDELENFSNLISWQLNKSYPISGVFRNFKNFIQIKKNLKEADNANSLSLKRMYSVKKEVDVSVNNNDINSIIAAINADPIQVDIFFNNNKSLKKISYKKLAEEFENVVYDCKIGVQGCKELLQDWCLNQWDKLNENFLSFKIKNLYEEYMKKKTTSNSKNTITIGNMHRKLLALHELCGENLENFCGMILSFEKSAVLGPNAKLSFYSDPYGDNLIDEIVAIKDIKNNLESVLFNQTKVWMMYSPGTTAFYIDDWDSKSIDSDLPCCITYVPYNWSSLIWLTDYCTSTLFKTTDVESLSILKTFVKKLFSQCITLVFPSEIQRNIFKITNRIILKAIKYISALENMKIVDMTELSIYEKFNLVGADEFSIIQLITNIDSCTKNEHKEKSFSSSYVVDGVEIILSVLAGIKESYNTLELYLKENFEYSLPLWIEAIIKLGQFLNYMQGSSSLEANLLKEIKHELSLEKANQFRNIFCLKNIPSQIEDEEIRKQIENILNSHNAKVVDKYKDIQIINDENLQYKCAVFVVDGYNVEVIKEPNEIVIVEEIPAFVLWTCMFCEGENDSENQMCLYCDRERTEKPREPPKKNKKGLVKIDAYNYTVSEIIVNLKNNLKNNEKLSSYYVKELFNSETMEKTLIVEETKSDVEAIKDSLIIEHALTTQTNLNSIEKDVLDKKETVLINSNEPTIQENKLNDPIYKDVLKKCELDICDFSDANLNTNVLNNFLKKRLIAYLTDKSLDSKLKFLIVKHINSKNKFELIKKLQNSIESGTQSTTSEKNNINEDIESIDFIKMFKAFERDDIDLWFESNKIDDKDIKEIQINFMEKIRELIDLSICKETDMTFVLPALAIRFIPEEYPSINQASTQIIQNYHKELIDYPLVLIRYYWAILRYFNSCLQAAMPFIKPPDMYNANEKLDDKEYYSVSFPKSISAFLSSAKGLTFSYIKSNLIREALASTEYSLEVVQIPSLKFERLAIISNIHKASQSKDYNKPSFIRQGEEEIEENNKEDELVTDQSMYLQAYDQAKELDPAFFRSMKAPSDPHIAFMVEFKGEHVQGIGGPYRQFFSDISLELQPKDYKNKKSLKILYPSSNNQEQKGDFKDKFVFTPGYISNTSLNHYEFLGILMGICIRTGVHLTLDLCSTEELITIDDIKEFDEGLIEQINFMNNIDSETFELNFNQNFITELTDGTNIELIPNGNSEKVLYEERFKYLNLLLKARLKESDQQISAVKRGLCKVIPYSLLKLLTFKELERLVVGKKTVDIDLLKSHTHYTLDLNDQSQRVKWLWELLNEIADEDKVKFIKFCWAQERLPATSDEYDKLQVIFSIKPYSNKSKVDVFPKADTCFFTLELPEYTSKDIMKKMIITAINLDNISINADKVSPQQNDSNQHNDRIRSEEYSDEEDY